MPTTEKDNTAPRMPANVIARWSAANPARNWASRKDSASLIISFRSVLSALDRATARSDLSCGVINLFCGAIIMLPEEKPTGHKMPANKSVEKRIQDRERKERHEQAEDRKDRDDNKRDD